MNVTAIQNWDTKGAVIATFLILGWLASTASLLIWGQLAWWTPLAVAVQSWLFTGLFITAHDAMHGTIMPESPRLNRAFGAIALGLYAFLPYDRLLANHKEHHAHPGTDHDPDYHNAGRPNIVLWYADFGYHYVTWKQMLGMAVAFNVMQHGLGIAAPNLLAYWVIPAVLSTLQLFYFGTYLPHRTPHDHLGAHNARSTPLPNWLSLITCFHFGGYHEEHHETPACPWWHLPSSRRVNGNEMDPSHS